MVISKDIYNGDICNLCWSGWHYYGKVCPGYYLISETLDNAFQIISYNAHKDDVFAKLKIKPEPCPHKRRSTKEEEEAMTLEQHNTELEWMGKFENNLDFSDFCFTITAIGDFYMRCKEAGYDNDLDSFIEYWVADKMGQLVAKESNLDE